MLDVSRGDLFAFYGTLGPGSRMAAELGLDYAGEFKGDCSIPGLLYDLGAYPGLVPGDGLVAAHLYQLNQVSLVRQLDKYEDVSSDEKSSLYVRQRVPVLTRSGEATEEQAWVYFYNQSVSGHRLIESGVWSVTATKRAKHA